MIVLLVGFARARTDIPDWLCGPKVLYDVNETISKSGRVWITLSRVMKHLYGSDKSM